MQTLDYNDKVVMITGAGSGMGKLAAENFSKAGATLAICDVNKENIEAVAAQLREEGCDVLAAAFDVSDESQVTKFVADCLHSFGKIDVAINNAGILPPVARTHLLDLSVLDMQYKVNIKGVFTCMKHQITAMKEASNGVILNLSSVAGLGAAANLSTYAASKHAVIGLTRSAAVEYGRYGLRINALCPSHVDSPMMDSAEKESHMSKENIAAANPMKRLATMQEIVNAMLWLCSDYNSYMNGTTIAIDGGLTAM
jgi:NAD(P)-dependent dehydrogenase (short-subunit alcohol dehydrogenase family)